MNTKTIKNKLNDPDVETTTTINIFKEGFPPTIVSDKYPVKNHSIKLTSIISEQEVLKEFEKLGYKNKIHPLHSHMVYLMCDDEDPDLILTIYINKESRVYWKSYTGNEFGSFTLQEHLLLHKLFEIWGWFDE